MNLSDLFSIRVAERDYLLIECATLEPVLYAEVNMWGEINLICGADDVNEHLTNWVGISKNEIITSCECECINDKYTLYFMEH